MDNLISDIDAFCERHGMSEGQFGLLSLNDKNLVPQIKAGRDLRTSTVTRIHSWMDAYEADEAA